MMRFSVTLPRPSPRSVARIATLRSRAPRGAALEIPALRRLVLPFVGALLAACGPSGASAPAVPTTPAAIAAVGGSGSRATVSMPVAVAQVARVTDAAGRPVAGITVTFSVATGGGWTTAASVATDAAGEARTTWYLGPKPGEPQTLVASAGGVLTTAFTATADPLASGTTYHGASQYVEFTPGTLPVIVSAPHGGTLQPAGIPDRTAPGATTAPDTNTDVLAGDIADAFAATGAGSPHTVIVRLHRVKLDANREIVEAAEGNHAAERAWREYHGFIEAARQHIIAAHGRGLYLDLHGHGHAIQRLELGYLLSATDLAGTDAALNSTTLVQRSSIRSLAMTAEASHAGLIRGSRSLGSLFEARGFPAVPSTAQPDPGSDPYFTGGYNTARHGSRNGGPIDGIQIEANMQGVRDNATSRAAFAAAFAGLVMEYLQVHYGLEAGTLAR